MTRGRQARIEEILSITECGRDVSIADPTNLMHVHGTGHREKKLHQEFRAWKIVSAAIDLIAAGDGKRWSAVFDYYGGRKTQVQIAKDFGVTRGRIGQMIARECIKLRMKLIHRLYRIGVIRSPDA